MRLALFLALAFLLGCTPDAPEARLPDAPDPAPATMTPVVKTGAQMLTEQGFAALDGMTVGLIVNHTAMVDTTHLADLVHAAPNVTLGALFGPEHGLRGEADAGAAVADGRDVRTGVPIYSLYGQTRQPTDDMLDGLDALVFDIQDAGARFYTFISTMGLAMQSAARAGLPFIVLDRPNPLGDATAGFVREDGFESFVGQYPIPTTHGLSVGELALMIRGEGWLDGLADLDLRIVAMEGWHRTMLWPETGLPWTPTSPNIPTFETALVYPGAALFEGTAASEGRGTRTPFLLVGMPDANADALADTLNAYGLPGVRFEAARFTPESIVGMSASPKLEGEALGGVRHRITDAAAFRPVATGVYVLHAFYHHAPPAARAAFLKPRWLGLIAGTDRLHTLLTEGTAPATITAAWADEVADFRARRAAYLRYD